jgi:predicted metal-dependent hydrolase
VAVRQVTLQGLGNVSIYKRRGNRSLRLSIGADGEVRVSIPAWLPYKAGEQFALSKRLWIEQRREQTPSTLQHGQRVGKAHRLHFEPQPSLLRVNTRLHQNEIRVAHPATHTSADSSVQAAARKACIRALRREAEQLLPQRLATLSTQCGLGYNSVAVKHLKSRWGSCSSNRDITLNLFLMQLPWHLIDYVLIHELTHTKVMRHGPPFWEELSKHAPGAKQLRKEIAAHHPILTTFADDVA